MDSLNTQLKRLNPFLLFLLMPLLIIGCDVSGIGQEVEDTFDLIVQLPAVQTSMSGQITDAETGDVIGGGQLTVRVKGQDRDKIIDPILFEQITEARVEEGFIDLAVDEDVVPTASAPVRFSLEADAEGYITTSRSFSIDEAGQYNFEIQMVKEAQPPEGVAVKADQPSGAADSDGAMMDDAVVSTDPDVVSGGSAAVKIKKGTTVRDASGQPLSGQLSATVAYYNNQSEKALSAFPGGFENVTVTDASGQQVDGGTFVSGGFTSVKLRDASGREAETFSEPVDVAITVPAETVNPETGQPVKEGDVVPLWSYDAEAGVWVEEGTVTAGKSRGVTLSGPDASGNFTAQFEASHFSYWNVGWFLPPDLRCQPGASFNVSGNDSGASVRYIVFGPGYVHSFSSGASSFSAAQFPQQLPFLTAKAYYEGAEVGTQRVDQPCGKSADFPLSGMPNAAELVTVKLDVSIKCDKQEVLPSIDFRYKRIGASGGWNTATMENGSATVEGLVLDADYEVSVTYNDDGTQKTVTEEVTVEGEPDENGVIHIDRDFVDIDEVCENV